MWTWDRIWDYHRWQTVISPGTKCPWLWEAGHLAKEAQEKFSQTSEEQWEEPLLFKMDSRGLFNKLWAGAKGKPLGRGGALNDWHVAFPHQGQSQGQPPPEWRLGARIHLIWKRTCCDFSCARVLQRNLYPFKFVQTLWTQTLRVYLYWWLTYCLWVNFIGLILSK